jgi:hypothetical protein
MKNLCEDLGWIVVEETLLDEIPEPKKKDLRKIEETSDDLAWNMVRCPVCEQAFDMLRNSYREYVKCPHCHNEF